MEKNHQNLFSRNNLYDCGLYLRDLSILKMETIQSSGISISFCLACLKNCQNSVFLEWIFVCWRHGPVAGWCVQVKSYFISIKVREFLDKLATITCWRTIVLCGFSQTISDKPYFAKILNSAFISCTKVAYHRRKKLIVLRSRISFLYFGSGRVIRDYEIRLFVGACNVATDTHSIRVCNKFKNYAA
jgi:hypothetical protein